MTRLAFQLLSLAALAIYPWSCWLLDSPRRNRTGKVLLAIMPSMLAILVIVLNWRRIVENFQYAGERVSTSDALEVGLIFLVMLAFLIYSLGTRYGLWRAPD